MFRLIGLLITITILFSGCKSEDKIVPTDAWSSGCVNLAPANGGHKLSGMCCEYVDMALITFKQGKTITLDGTYHAFTGAGFSNVPVKIAIIVSAGGDKLKFSFIVYKKLYEYDLVPGAAKLVCECLCD